MIETPEPPHIHKTSDAHGAAGGPHGPVHRWFEWLTTIVLIVISACSLYVAYHTSYTMEKLVSENARLVRAQSTPLLMFSYGDAFDREDSLGAVMVNGGTGPARIIWSRFSVNGETHATFRAALTSQVPDMQTQARTVASALDGSLLRAGEERRILIWRLADTPNARPTWEAAERVLSQISAQACYCSLLDECWLTSFDGTTPRPVDACGPAPPVSRAT